MARIPLYTRQQGLAAPGMPEARLSGDIAAGGALARLGGDIAGLGNQVAGLSAHMQKRADEEDRFKAGVEDDARRYELSGALEKARQGAKEDAADFTSGYMAEADRIAADRIGKMPEGQRGRYQAQWQAERIQWQNKAAREELSLRGNYQRGKIAEIQNGLVGEIGQNPDPDAAEAIYQRGLERINSASALTSAERADLARRWEQTARTAELQKRFAADPDGMRRALGVSTPEIDRKNAARSAMGIFVREGGLSSVAAAAVIGNLMAESSLNPNARNPGDGRDGSDSIGVAQWNADRARALKAFASERGESWNSLGTQIAFIVNEMKTKERGAYDKLLRARTVEEATEAAIGYFRPAGWSAQNPRGGHNFSGRLANAQRLVRENVSEGEAGGIMPAETVTADARYSSIDQQFRERLIRNAENEARVESRRTENLLVDDINSIRATGRPVDGVNMDDVAKRLGPERAAEHMRERDREMRFFEATSDFDALPNDAIRARVDSLRPKGGSAGFTEEQKNFEEIQKRGEKVIQNRLSDPATSVDALDIVRDARSKIQYEGEGQTRRVAPASAQAVVQARLKAQESLGIERPYALTRREAQTLARQLRQIGEDNEAGVSQFLEAMKRTYGDFAPVVLQSMLELENVNRELSAAATRVMTDVMRSKIPDISSVRQLDANLAWRDAETAGGSALAGTAGPRGPSPQVPGATFDPADMQWLWQNRDDPNAKAEFNAKYPGQADRVLQDLSRRLEGTRNGR